MKKRGRKTINCQKSFRKKIFPFTQYWLMYYTERYNDNSEKDFVTFIRAKSYAVAKIILLEKSKEDLSTVKVKAILGYMLHKNYRHTKTNKILSVSDWENIRNSSFPNINNFLFKKELPRREGYSNRFNKTNFKQLKTIGFKKGKDNWARKHRKGVFKKLHERKGLKWSGDKWIEWDKEEMVKTKNNIVNALVLHDNNRKRSAEFLNIGRTKLYKLMVRCETRAWWNENYPPQKPIPPRVSSEQRSETQKRVMQERKARGEKFFDKSFSGEQKRIKALQLAKKEEGAKYKKNLIPVIKKALNENNNIRTLAAKSLNIKYDTFRAWLQRTRHLVNWSNDYPSAYNNSEVTWKTINK